jgi:hypothetical protein
MSRAVRLALLTVLAALVTWIGGWWAVPLLGFGWRLVVRTADAWEMGLAALLAWSGLLALASPAQSTGALVHRLAGLFHLPGLVPLVVTPLFAALLGWSAAGLAAGLAPRR